MPTPVEAPKESYELRRLREQQEKIAKWIVAEEAAEKERAIIEKAKRQKAYEQLAWHPDFDVHDLSKLRVTLDGSFHEMPASIFCSPAAKRILNQASAQLSCEDPPLTIDQRRELIATTFEKIIVAAQPTFWQRVKKFLSAWFSR